MAAIRKKTKSRSIKESTIQRSILQWLQINKYYTWRNYLGPVIHRTGQMSPNPARGLPDIMGIFKDGSGRLFAIEVKAMKGKLQPHQKERIDGLNAAGCLAFVAHDLDTVISTLRKAEDVSNGD